MITLCLSLCASVVEDILVIFFFEFQLHFSVKAKIIGWVKG